MIDTEVTIQSIDIEVTSPTDSDNVSVPSGERITATITEEPIEVDVATDGPQGPAGPAGGSAVDSVNGQTGAVVITKSDVGLGNVQDLDQTNPANITQDSTHRFATDAEKSSWDAKQSAIGYTPENVANKQTDLVSSSTHYPTVDAVNTGLSGKQDSLGYTAENVANKQTDLTSSSTKYPTVDAVNSGLSGKQSSLGFTPEDVANKQTDLTSSSTKYPTIDAVNTGLSAKQEALVSGTNIKTLDGQSILGSGNVDIILQVQVFS